MNDEQQELDIEDNSEFAKMLEEQEQSNAKSGGIVNALIVKITDEIVLLDTNQKMEKRMPISEIKDSNGEFLFKVNDSIDIIIERGIPSYKKVLSRKKIKEFVEKIDNKEVESIIKVKVTGKNQGGYIVQYEDMSFFMPRSLSMLRSTENHINREIDVAIIKHDANDGILVSRKHFLDTKNEELEKRAEELLKEDKPVKCIVEKLINFGVFVSVEGIAGVIKYSELSHKGNVNPRDSFKTGQEIEAKLLGLDKKRKILELSVKALLEDPWEDIDNQVKIGDKVQGKVVNIQPYGAFVNLEGKDLDALLHISEISWDKNIKSPSDRISLEEELELIVIDINKEKKQLKCSLKQLSEKPFSKFINKYDVGDIVKGNIVHITDFGAFIHIDFMDCLLLNVNCSWEKGDTCKSLFKVGDEIEVSIESIDKENGKAYLNKKTLLESPIDKFSKTYNVGDKVKGVIATIKDFGVFVTVDNLLDIFIPIKDIFPLKPNEINVGDEIESIIADINIANARVRASVQDREKEEEDMKSFGDDSKMTLGDALRMKK